MEDVSKILLEIAVLYQTDPKAREALDRIYGKVHVEFVGKAIEAFYK